MRAFKLVVKIHCAIAMILLASCTKQVYSDLLLSPEEITLFENDTGYLYLAVQPAVKTNWYVSTKPDFLIVNPSSGVIDSDVVQLMVTLNTEGLNFLQQFANIEIISDNSGTARTTVNLKGPFNPIVEFEPLKIHFLESEFEKQLTLKNAGGQLLNWKFLHNMPYMEFSADSGTLKGGHTQLITATVQRNFLQEGVEYGSLTIISNDPKGSITADVEMVVPPAAIFVTSADRIQFGYFQESVTFYLHNQGNTSAVWQLINPAEYLVFDISSGVLSNNDSVKITVNIDRTDLSTMIYEGSITFTNEAGLDAQMPFYVENYKEEKVLLEGWVIDAEYNINTEALIIVLEQPNELRKYNTQDMTTQTIELELYPNAVAVSGDGTFAVVGHNGSFSYIDLINMTIVQTFPLTVNVFDILIAPNQWVYVFPYSGNSFKCIDLNTGIEINNIGTAGVTGGERIAKLNSTGDAIYQISVSKITKYDITLDTAFLLYSKSFTSYFIDRKLWIPGGGNRIFTEGSLVFWATSSQNTDITYNGTLAGTGKLRTIDFNSAVNKVYAVANKGNSIYSEPESIVRVFDGSYLSYLGSINLPKFLYQTGPGGGSQFFDAEGYFGFFNSTGTKFFVLAKSAAGSFALNEWAIITVNVE